MRCSKALAVAVVAATIGAACGRQPASAPAAPPAAAETPAQTAAAGSATPHGDHNPHHGGVVMMKGDLHYEVVIDPSGKEHHVYFTDAVREDLPASIASNVVLTIHRPAKPDEQVFLAIDDSGESWVGRSAAVALAPNATVGVSFTYQEEPYTIELPIAQTTQPAPSAKPNP